MCYDESRKKLFVGTSMGKVYVWTIDESVIKQIGCLNPDKKVVSPVLNVTLSGSNYVSY